MKFDITNLILHKRNFLSKKECDYLIDYYEKHKARSALEHCPEATTGIDTMSTFDVIDVEYGDKEHKFVSKKIEEMINLYHKHTDKFDMFHVLRKKQLLYSHKLRLMKYKKGAKIHPHTDHDPYVYGSCTFNLNDDYEGGEFGFFKNKKTIKLKRGDALIWPADYFWVHEVKPIKKGVRYSTNCFLQCLPQSIVQNLHTFRDVLEKNYKFNSKDGLKYNIKRNGK
jgi:hypothetical protein